jgi:hypothetical protein
MSPSKGHSGVGATVCSSEDVDGNALGDAEGVDDGTSVEFRAAATPTGITAAAAEFFVVSSSLLPNTEAKIITGSSNSSSHK